MGNPHLFFYILDWKIHKYSRLMNSVIFWIHQSVTKIRFPDSAIWKSTSCFRNKVKVNFEIYKIVGVQEEKRRGAGKRSHRENEEQVRNSTTAHKKKPF